MKPYVPGVMGPESGIGSRLIPGACLPSRGACKSPSLSVAAGPEAPAFEMKYLVTEVQAKEIEERAKNQLLLDPHADPCLGNAYRITSVYCDTWGLDVFHRTDGFKRTKHRLRRYGESSHLFLERKARWQDRVKKRRTMIPSANVALLLGAVPAVDWAGHWFHRHLLVHSLAPVCRISYERVAYVGKTKLGPLRLTFDRKVRGVLTSAWELEGIDEGNEVAVGSMPMPLRLPNGEGEMGKGKGTGGDLVICEFKFRTMLPSFFKEIMREYRLRPCPVSKYRAFIRACKFSREPLASAGSELAKGSRLNATAHGSIPNG